MRVLITSGIFAPESGGPATYAPQLAAELTKLGHSVSVLALSAQAHYESDAAYPFTLARIVRGGKLLNRIRFFFAAYAAMRDRDIVYTLDWFAVGLPVALAAKLRRVPYVVRIGGDYLWEQRYLESKEAPVTLREFYERGLYRRVAYKLPMSAIRFVLRGASDVVFNSEVQRELYERSYGLLRTTTIENALPSLQEVRREGATKEFVFWGRLIVMKNLETLLRAFAKAKIPQEFTLSIIGDGPQKEALIALARELSVSDRVHFEPSMPLDRVLERVKNARAFILPSWTDISPNQVYEALAIGLPALVSKENYLAIRDRLPQQFDPRSIGELAQKLELLADDAMYAAFAAQFGAIDFTNTWRDVALAHLRVFDDAVGSGGFRVLQIGADRSKRGIMYPGSPAFERQKAYAKEFGKLDIIALSRSSDGARPYRDEQLAIVPTSSSFALEYGLDARSIAKKLPRPSVVSAQDPFETGLIAWLIARKKRVPLHVQVHTDFLSPEYARHSLVNRIRVRIARFVLKRAARVRVVSERIKSELSHLVPQENIAVLPIFVDIEKFKAARAPALLEKRFAAFKTKLLVVSRLEPEKNVALALRAFAQSAPTDACLIILGEGSDRRILELLARELGISARVFFEGTKPGIDYYPIANLVLVPSRYEGYGLVFVEALASGVPVLSSDVGIAREAGAIVTSPEEFGAALAQWFENGPRTGQLTSYPYKDFAEYVRAYGDDIRAAAQKE